MRIGSRTWKTLLFIGTTAVLGVALAQGVKQLSVTLAGKALKLDSVVVGGKTYVSLEQLKKALPNPAPATGAAGGANQVAAASGCIGEYLFNGVWRLKVQSLMYSLEEKAWYLTIELRNGTNKISAPYNTGSSGSGDDISLLTEDGNSLSLANGTRIQDDILLKSIAPGAAGVTKIWFNAESATPKATKLLWAMSAANNSDKAPLSKQPGFRVDLTCQK
jgi:hypothetical protein